MEKQIAAKQARLALEEVSPFCDPNNSDNEDIESLDEALALKAKACFRLGSAQYEMGDYSDAIYSLEESIRSTNDISDPIDNIPDSLVLRRLAHAKREHLKHTKRQRKKFKFAFSSSSLQSDLSASTSLPSTPMFSTASRLAPSIPLLSSTTMSPVERIESTVVTATSTATAAPNSTTTVNTANTVTPINSPATTETVATATATSLGAGSTKD